MRSCCSPSSLRGISRAAWRHAVASTPTLTGGSHQQQQCHLRYLPLPLRPRAPPNALGLAERLFSCSSTKRSTKKDIPVDSTSGGDPFYVVRKGDLIGIYKNLPDCQAQVSNSVGDPSVTVFKGSSLHKETEEYLPARGLKNALYSINAADVKDELFDDLALCPFRQPDANATSTLEKPQEMETALLKKHPKVAELEPLPDSDLSCILEFDGANKGHPCKYGAAVIVRRLDGSVIAQLREGLGSVTKNTAEYRALLLGLRYADKKGFKYIRAQGDAELICNQEFNADVHAQAKLAVELPADTKVEFFDDLALCPFQETGPLKKHPKVAEQEPLPDSHLSCILEFDGACLGNPSFPRKSGAGVIVRRPDGSVIAQLREGLGSVTDNTSEYRALLLGLRYAANNGFKYVHAQGNSENVCNQAQGLWRPQRDHMVDLCKKVKQLKGRFLQIQINLVSRKCNVDADAQARLATELPVGEIQEESNITC